MKNGLVINKYGSKIYYKNNMMHREDGPAIVYEDGKSVYYINDIRHREDGPAVIYPDGGVEYWINGELVDAYHPDFGRFEPKSREEALKWLNSKKRPYFRELYLADIDAKWPVAKKKKLFSWFK